MKPVEKETLYYNGKLRNIGRLITPINLNDKARRHVLLGFYITIQPTIQPLSPPLSFSLSIFLFLSLSLPPSGPPALPLSLYLSNSHSFSRDMNLSFHDTVASQNLEISSFHETKIFQQFPRQWHKNVSRIYNKLYLGRGKRNGEE